MYEAHFVPMAGCVLNTINTRLEAETIAIFGNSDSRLLIADTAFSDTIFAALDILDHDVEVIDIRDAVLGDLPARGKMDYDFIATAPDYDCTP